MTTAERDHLRWWIAIILSASAALNYLDRQALSILVETIEKEIALTTTQYSYITAIFLFGYTAMTGVSGRLLDHFGTKKVLAVAVLAWSFVSACHSLCRTAGQLLFAHLLLGICQSANWPAGVKATAEWFPVEERAFAVGIFNSGSSVGAAISASLVSFVALRAGWRMAFLSTLFLGILWAIAFLYLYRSRGQKLPHSETRLVGRSSSSISIGRVLQLRASWGCFVARIFIDPVTYLFIFWIPKYLQMDWNYKLVDIEHYLWAPYIALAIGTVLGGEVPRRLTRIGWTVNRARKSTMLASSLMILFCALALIEAKSAALVLLALALFMSGHGFWGNIAIPAEVFPSEIVGTVAGVGGLLGGIAGMLAQLLIGWTLQKHSFVPIFFCAGGLYLMAFAIVSFLIPNLGKQSLCLMSHK